MLFAHLKRVTVDKFAGVESGDYFKEMADALAHPEPALDGPKGAASCASSRVVRGSFAHAEAIERVNWQPGSN